MLESKQEVSKLWASRRWISELFLEVAEIVYFLPGFPLV